MNHARVALFVVLLSLLPNTWAARVLIIFGNGQQAVQNALRSTDTVELRTSIPDGATLAGFDQVWDLRGLTLDPPGRLSDAEITAYRNYLALGRTLVVLGEHNSGCATPEPCFKPRNDSILKLIEEAGGGQLAYATVGDTPNVGGTQTVQAPFTGPNPIGNNDVDFGTAAGVATPGTGQFITIHPTGAGTALAFARGSLANATAGTLIVVFDQNWLGNFDPPDDGHLLLRNIIAFLTPQLPDVNSVQCRESPTGTLGRCTFNTPMGVAARNGNVYAVDTALHAVYRIDAATQQKVLIAGLQLSPLEAPDVRYNGDGIDGRQALLNNPTGLALDAVGNLYIADTGNHAIRRLAADASGVIPDGAVITTVAGVPTQFGVGDPLLLFGPRGIAFDEEGTLFIADTMNQQIRRLVAADGSLAVVAGIAGLPGRNNGPVSCTPPCATPPARLNKPVGVAVDSLGRVFVADEGNNRVRMVADGFVGNTTTANPLRRPTAVVLAPGGATLLAADYGNHVIRQVAPCGDCSSPDPDVVAGTDGVPGSSGPALNSPIGISVDGFTLYIADLLNNRIGRVPLSD